MGNIGNNLAAGTVSAVGMQLVAVASDVKSSATDGGTFTTGARRTRTLNTLVEHVSGVVSLSSDKIVFAVAGSYLIRWSCPGYKCGLHRSTLRNVTTSTDIGFGTTENSSATDATVTRSHGAVKFYATATTEVRIEHQSSVTQSSNGFGVSTGFGESEVYTIAEIWRV